MKELNSGGRIKMKPSEKARITKIIEYLKRCREQKEQKINLILHALARS